MPMPTGNAEYRVQSRLAGVIRNWVRAVQEYLHALEQDGQVGVTPTNSSLTDPAARWTAAPGGPAFYAYSTNYLVDVHAGVIVDVEATAAYRIEETEATKTMVERVEDRFGIKPKHLIGDTAYGTAALLNWMVEEKHIEPHVPVWERYQRTDGSLSERRKPELLPLNAARVEDS
jgi:hypothetical protein